MNDRHHSGNSSSRLLLSLALVLLAALPSLGQNGSLGDPEALPETPLPLRIPEASPPSPEVPLPDASALIREGRLQWSSEVDPDLTWMGAPWDYLPPVDDQDPDSPRGGATSGPSPEDNLSPPDGTSPQPSVSATPAPPVEPSQAPSPEPPRTAQSQGSVSSSQSLPGNIPGEAGTTVGTIPEIAAAAGEVTSLSLPGAGWIFVGVIPRDADLELIESQSGAGETLFRFRPRDAGELLLSFQRQDVTTGSFEESTISIDVLEEGAEIASRNSLPSMSADSDERDPQSSASGNESAGGPSGALMENRQRDKPELEVTIDGDGDYAEARRLVEQGERQSALESFLAHYNGSGSPELHDQIASLARDLGYPEIAAFFWRENSDLASDLGTRARQNVVEWTVMHDSLSDLEQFFDTASRYGDMPQADQLFTWAQRFDIDGPAPEVRRAVLLYQSLLDWYPASVHAPEAQGRLRFLRRHFLQVR